MCMEARPLTGVQSGDERVDDRGQPLGVANADILPPVVRVDQGMNAFSSSAMEYIFRRQGHGSGLPVLPEAA